MYICKLKRESISKSDFKFLQKNSKYSQAYTWVRVYDVFTCGGSELLVYRSQVDNDGNFPPLDSCQVVSNYSQMFDDLHTIHCTVNGHAKGRTLIARVKEKFGKSIPQWVQRIFTDTCLRCIENMECKTN